ncbi:peptidase, S41 family [Prevotella sp. DNF00663]|uniref:S41 family peptidase n=1 Tax=unclassified Prevotella TaxID=2638335 RepID=UPI00051346AC|nr:MULTISPECIES: S41 family peptidase [unclassified Prevotella]KGI60020.1 peptidase S41 [Prevotella sp. S7 MS 2]KXB82838.1 peptidase, S41 family [Prevotella sp. DNF00663]
MKKILSLFLLLATLPAMAQSGKEHNFDVAKNLDVFNVLYKNLDLLYVDTLDANTVIGNGINAMLSSLDPYTEYYPEDKTKEFKTVLTGKYAGIGAIISYNFKLKKVVINEPYEGMPAAEAGLKKGDIILSIDNESMEGKANDYVSNHLRGEAGTSFILTYKRPSTNKTTKVKITRRAIQMPAVPYYGMVTPSVGYINLNSFTEKCSKDVRKAFIDLKGQGMKQLVFDLRGNGGGLEQEAVNIVNLFVPNGKVIVSNRGKQKSSNHDYRTTVEPLDTVMPIVVLVDGHTASSSEITSGALQDLDRAVIMGTRTYGKGLVQMTLEMPYNGMMKLTTNKYYIPSGRCIQAINYNRKRGEYTEHIPDSLTKVFYTAGGREVRDGGGIKPDVEVKPDTLSNLTLYLSNRSGYAGIIDSTEQMLTYEQEYIAKHPTIAQPTEFQLSEQDWQDFRQRVINSKFSYDRESEKYLKNLVKLAKFEGYYDDAKADFDNLEKKLSHNIAKDLDKNKAELMQELGRNIVSAYYYQAGQIKFNLRFDKTMKEALRLLSQPDEYNKILRPKK